MAQTKEQKKAFFLAQQAGAIRDIAISRGGTGDLRKQLSDKEVAKRKARRQMAKLSRKQNR